VLLNVPIFFDEWIKMVDNATPFFVWHLVHSFIQNPLETRMNEFELAKHGLLQRRHFLMTFRTHYTRLWHPDA
jgi:hypothetical protein